MAFIVGGSGFAENIPKQLSHRLATHAARDDLTIRGNAFAGLAVERLNPIIRRLQSRKKGVARCTAQTPVIRMYLQINQSRRPTNIGQKHFCAFQYILFEAFYIYFQDIEPATFEK